MITVERPPKYTSCISCGTKENLHEYLFSIRDDGIKQCITICNDCVAEMYKKSGVAIGRDKTNTEFTKLANESHQSNVRKIRASPIPQY